MSVEWIQDRFESWDKEEIFFRYWNPPGAMETAMLLHGFGEHSGRYEKFPRKMPGLPIRMAVMDLRGMGNAGRKRMAACSLEDYLQDISAFEAHLCARGWIHSPVILLGHSFGGLLAVEWAVRYPTHIKKLILSSPFLGIKNLPLLRFLNQLVVTWCPGWVYHNPILPRALTHDSAEVSRYKTDPLIERKISACLTKVILDRLVLYAKQPYKFPFPVHILAAGDEKVVDLRATRRFFENLQVPQKKLIEFDGFYHEIFNEIEQQKAFDVLKTIIENCV